jgi:hypothetical protein
MAAQNESSIWASLAPIAARNTRQSPVHFCVPPVQFVSFGQRLRLRLEPQELQKYNPLDVALQPFAGGRDAQSGITVICDTGKDRSSDHNPILLDRYSLSALPENYPS